ncbi:MAG: CPXCG motif-containing cysteine-rich protein [Pyrinomonadaceae bacterium]|nr:CPXCG motif-containing cysteine-rich protein [Pyrinomonadaceae bacterium]
MEIEHFFICPYCWEEISMLLDLTTDEQSYIEDCEVCCQPIQISYTAEDFEMTSFDANAVE